MKDIETRLRALEHKHQIDIPFIEFIYFDEGEDPKKALKKKEAEINQKIDYPIFIRIIPDGSKG